MKPYIAIAEKTKADAMKLFDEDFGITSFGSSHNDSSFRFNHKKKQTSD